MSWITWRAIWSNPYLRIVVLILLSFGILFCLGTSFDKLLWNNLIIGIVSNLLVLFPVFYLVEATLYRHKRVAYSKLNDNLSKGIDFVSNKLALDILNYLDLPHSEIRLTNYEQATKDLAKARLSTVVYQRLISLDVEKRAEYVNGLEAMLKTGFQHLTKSLREIRPLPDPDLLSVLSETQAGASGVLLALRILCEGLHEVKMDREDERLMIKLFIDANSFESISRSLDQIAKRAQSDSLFLVFED